MDTKNNFKEFVKIHPELINHVKNGNMTWQKFYEIYDMYGEDENAWKDFITVPITTIGTFDIMNFLKSLDLDSIKEGVNNIQRVLGLLQDMNQSEKTVNNPKPRPIYKHFED